MLLVDVCINLPVKSLNNIYTYCLPECLSAAGTGWRVLVPFASAKAEGFILQKYEGQDGDSALKCVEEVLDKEAWFDEKMIALATWLSDYYLCTLAEAMRLFLPGKKSLSAVLSYKITDNAAIDDIADDKEGFLLRILSANVKATLEKLKKLCGNDIKPVLDSLERRGLIKSEKEYISKFKKRMVSYVEITEAGEEYLSNATKCPAARKKALEILTVHKAAPLALLQKNGISRDTVLRMQKIGLVKLYEKESIRNSYSEEVATKEKVRLNDQQQAAVDIIVASMAGHTTFLLQGVTGSGKTEVYLAAAEEAVNRGRQVLVMVPEIALTGQIISRFKERFGERVVVVHSRLSLNERMDVFEYIKTGEPCILIGARSALFAPFRALGLVVMDEEHEFSYKQEERPSYHARTVAEELAVISSVPLVLGSATPDLESYHKALSSQYTLLKLTKRPASSALPAVTVVDMKAELEAGNRGVLSHQLLSGLEEIKNSGEQAIILLNRRGFSTFVLCRDCGYAVRCQHCAVSLVYHAQDTVMRCHYCGHTEQVPSECPACKSRRIRFFGSGTQKAEAQIQELLPGLSVIRMDQDTTGKKFAHDEILAQFRQSKYRLLLGTQMVAKGHDVPNVTLVGILSADSIINLPDFRAAERTFSLLTQAAGRAGRGEKPGKVILQVYESEHPAIQYAVQQDYDSFAAYELEERRELFYPPFSSIIKVTVTGKEETAALKKSMEFVDKLIESGIHKNSRLEINGPFQGMVAKIKDIFKINILLKTDKANMVKQWLKTSNYLENKDILIDIDPLNVI